MRERYSRVWKENPERAVKDRTAPGFQGLGDVSRIQRRRRSNANKPMPPSRAVVGSGTTVMVTKLVAPV